MRPWVPVLAACCARPPTESASGGGRVRPRRVGAGKPGGTATGPPQQRARAVRDAGPAQAPQTARGEPQRSKPTRSREHLIHAFLVSAIRRSGQPLPDGYPLFGLCSQVLEAWALNFLPRRVRVAARSVSRAARSQVRVPPAPARWSAAERAAARRCRRAGPRLGHRRRDRRGRPAGGVATGLRQGRPIGGDHRRAARHRLQAGQAEALIATRAGRRPAHRGTGRGAGRRRRSRASALPGCRWRGGEIGPNVAGPGEVDPGLLQAPGCLSRARPGSYGGPRWRR